MLLSRFTPLGLLELSNEEPLAERMYDDAVASLGDQYSLEEDDHMEGVLYASAIEGACAAEAVQRGQAQRYADEVSHHLPQREYEYGIVPGPTDTMADRRAVYAARKLRPSTWTEAEIITALQNLLGDVFVTYRTCPVAERVMWPTNCGDQPMNLVRENVARKIVRLLGAVSVGLPGAVTVAYEMVSVPQAATAQSDATELRVGDRVSFDVGHSSIGEVVEVTAVTPGATPTFTASFTKPHSSGALGFTNPFPWWISTQRQVLVVLTAAAAQDPETRRKVDEQMPRMLRSTTAWGIVAADGGDTQSFLLDVPSLDFTTLEPSPL